MDDEDDLFESTSFTNATLCYVILLFQTSKLSPYVAMQPSRKLALSLHGVTPMKLAKLPCSDCSPPRLNK